MTPYHCAVTWALDTSNSNSNSNKDKEKEKKKHHHHHDEEKKDDEKDDKKENDKEKNDKDDDKESDSFNNNTKQLLKYFKSIDPPLAKMFERWINGDEDFKDARLKMIPRVVNGGILLKKAMGTGKPTLFATKMKCYYFDHINTKNHYLEIDVDTHSSEIARRVLGMVKKCATAMVLEVGLCLEGREEAELPEVLLGGVCFSKFDMDKSRVLKGVDPGVEIKQK